MTEAQSPFSGGGGYQAPVDPNRTPPKEIIELMAILNKRAIETFIIDPDVSKIEVTFTPASGTVTIKTGESLLSFPYRKIV